MRAKELEPRDRERLRRELTLVAKGWWGRAWRMKVLLAGYATKVRKTGVRTDADAEGMTLAWHRLHEAIYYLNLIKQALIGL